SIEAYYVVNHDDVISCLNKRYVAGIDDEWVDYEHYSDKYGYTFHEGDVVYVRAGYTTPSGKAQGITWGLCANQQDTENGWQWYGYIDMAYLTPYDEYYAPEPEPEPEPVETEPPTDPPTEAPTTVVTTIATTAVTTIFTTLAPTEAETTMLTTTTTTQQTDAAMSIIDNQNDDHKNDFFSDNFTLLLIGGIVVLLAGSGALAIGLMQHSKKKQMFLPNSQNGQGFVGVHFCPQCGMRNPKTAAFCKKCGKPMK
ncbi:MAG: zinc ribbon domain-containing protein, partial [Oscillospiraceae bacterium]|nr:zinc ribbon domain-containing protein [Oscillospiraceae bacterium]